MALMLYFEIVCYMVYANLKAEASRGLLGFFWWILEPVLYMSIFYLVFTVIFKRGGEGFVPFLLTGLTAWKWFHASVYQGAMSIQAGAGLMRQVYLPKHIFPLVVVFTNLYKFLIVLLTLVVFLVFYGKPIVTAWCALPVVVVVQGTFIFAVASLLAAMIPFVPDLQKILENILTLAMFVSGVFFDIGKSSPKVIYYSKFNPMTTLMTSYRKILLDGQWPNWWDLGAVSVVSLIGVYIAVVLLRRLDMVIPKAVV